MKINTIISQSINNANYTVRNTAQKNHTNPQTNQVQNFNLNSLNKNYNQLSFKGVDKAVLDMVKQIPLKDRLGTLLGLMDYNDIIIVGKKLEKAKKGLLQSVGEIEQPIKRLYFIPDENINGYVGFTRNETWEHEAINLNDFELGLVSNNKSYVLEPHQSFYITDGDFLLVQGKTLDINLNPKADLRKFINIYSKSKNFKNEVNTSIEQINRKTFSQIAQDTETKAHKVTFKDVGGQDELIDEMKKSIIYPLKYPEAYSNFEINRGFILYGPPGTGKTHIARALANEADVNFISLNGTEMESKWVGESEANWRNLFDEAKEKQPTIMFIDEFDAVTKERGGKDVYGDKVVNQILTLMTDLDNNKENVFVIGATNNFKALDKAIIRSGRFGKHLEVKMPDLDGIKKIFEIHTQNKPLDRNLNKDILTQRLYDLKTNGADIKYIVNEAHSEGYTRAGIFEKMDNGTLTSRDINHFWITQNDFENAIKKFVETRNGTERQPIGFSK